MLDTNFGTPVECSATAFLTITTAPSTIIGILFHGTGTGLIDGIYNCKSTTSATAATRLASQIIAYATVTGATANAAVYYPYPAACTEGVVVDIGASADPKVTLFIVAGNG